MLNLKKKNYPIEQFIGIVEIIKWFVDAENYSYLNGIQISLFVFKYRFEGFRGSILVYLLGVLFGYIFESQSLIAITSLLFMYASYRLTVYELPQGGVPVGHKWIRGDWLHQYKLDELSIYYPAEIQNTDKIGFKWLKVNQYHTRMYDTANKDLKRLSKTPKFIFWILSSSFKKMYLWVYENSKIINKNNLYSVIIISHGLASHCDGYSVIARYLAQQGYIVFCPEHFEHIPNIFYEDELNKIYRFAQMRDRFKTIQSTINIIHDQERIQKLFTKNISIDLSDISIIGHSFGASTAIYSTMHDKRITGVCIAYDPCLYVFEDFFQSMSDTGPKLIHIPILSINSHDFYQRLYPFMENDKRLKRFFSELQVYIYQLKEKKIQAHISQHSIQLYIENLQHADFCDFPIIWNGEAGLTKVSINVETIQIRVSLIQSLTKSFLDYKQQTKNTPIDNANQQQSILKSTLLSQVQNDLGEKYLNLIRWQF